MDGSARVLLANTGALIAEVRRSRGLSQEDLAHRCRLHRNTVGKLERGEVEPSLTGINRVYIQLQVGRTLFTDEGVIPAGSLAPELVNRYSSVTPLQSLAMIAACLRRLRLHRRLSLVTLARAAGVHLNTLWGLENRTVDPSLITIYRVYRALDVSNVSLDDGGLSFKTSPLPPQGGSLDATNALCSSQSSASCAKRETIQCSLSMTSRCLEHT